MDIKLLELTLNREFHECNKHLNELSMLLAWVEERAPNLFTKPVAEMDADDKLAWARSWIRLRKPVAEEPPKTDARDITDIPFS